MNLIKNMRNVQANKSVKLIFRILIFLLIDLYVLSCQSNSSSYYRNESLYDIEIGLLKTEFCGVADTCMIYERILPNNFTDSNLYHLFHKDVELEPLILNRINGTTVDSEAEINNSTNFYNEYIRNIEKTDLKIYRGSVDDLYILNVGQLDTIEGNVVFVPNFNKSNNMVILCHVPIKLSDELYLVRSNIAFSGSNGHFPVSYNLYSFNGKEWEFIRKVYGGVGIN